jgi:hypothetical protein
MNDRSSGGITVRCSRVLDTFILYNWLPSGGRKKMQERMQRTMDLLVRHLS